MKTETAITNKKHSRLSCSGSDRFISCTGSLLLCEQLNPTNKRTSNSAAAQGTVAHELCDLCITNRKKPEYYLGDTFTTDGYSFIVDQEMADAVNVYLNYISGLPSGENVHSEQWCSLEYLGIPGLNGGTTDAIVIDEKHKTIYIIDFKYGQGVVVEVTDNTQLKCYAAGALDLLSSTLDVIGYIVKLVIVQPRAFHPDGPVRELETTADDIFDWANNILKPAALAALQPGAPLTPNDKACRFCSAAGDCPALYSKAQEMAVVDFDDIEIPEDSKFPPVPTLTPTQKIGIMEHSAAIKAFITAVEGTIKNEMESGSQAYATHFKLVRKQTHRKFIDEIMDDLESPLLDLLPYERAFTTKLKGLTEIERSLKESMTAKQVGEILAGMVTKPEGTVVVAKLTDKRKAIEASAQREFEDFTD